MKYGLLLSIFFFNNTGVGCQVSDNRWQKTETVCPMSSVICFLCSVLWILLTPDTIDIVLFKELNWTKIDHTTFVTFWWDTTLGYDLQNIYRDQKACHHNRCDIGFLVYRKLGCPGGPIISNAARSETVQTTPRGGCPKRYPDNDQRKDGAVIWKQRIRTQNPGKERIRRDPGEAA